MRTLGDKEYDKVWDSFYKAFSFRPSVDGPFPAILEPKDSITFDFPLPRDIHDEMIVELAEAIFESFSESIRASDEIYYLDWQHECFAITLNDITNNRFNAYPNGDYAILISKDMRVGTFGHPWEDTICIFGESFVKAMLQRKPKIFHTVVRNSGGYACA